MTVNGNTAILYSDYTFASSNAFTITNGNNTFTAIAGDALGRSDTNAITVNLPATNSYTYTTSTAISPAMGRGRSLTTTKTSMIQVFVTNIWKTTFTYDGKMRLRIRKEYTHVSGGPGGGSYVQTNEVHYIYDGNLVIQERTATNLPTISYTRGTDISGFRQGAGGVGGMLARTDHTQVTPSHAYYHTDGNGNITALINADQFIAARYEYDPYGNVLSQSGPLADANTYRFSSKEYMQNAGLVYYLYRFYEPALQRWLNRDPIGEAGGINLYEFVGNNPVGNVDPYGLAFGDWWDPRTYSPGYAQLQGQAALQSAVEPRGLR